MKTKLKGIIFSLLGLGALLILVLKLDLDISIFYSITQVPYLVLAALFILILPLIWAFRMRYLLLAVEESSVPIKSLIAVEYMNKFFYNTAPAKMHLAAKVIMLDKMCDVKLRNGASIVTLEYALDAGITLFFAMLGIFFFFRDLPQVSTMKLTGIIVLLLACATIFFKLHIHMFDRPILYFETLHMPIIKPPLLYLFRTLKVIRETWMALIFNKRMYYIFPISLLYWGALVLSIEFLFLSTGIFVPLVWILVVTTCAVFVGGISTIPGGLGVRDATMILLYGVLGVSYQNSLVVIILLRILLWGPAFLGYILTVNSGFRFIKNQSL